MSGLILDASATLAWIFQRTDPAEVQIANELLARFQVEEALVPAIWFPEVANGLLVAERRAQCDAAKSIYFLSRINGLPIKEDAAGPSATQAASVALGRAHKLTAYDATYLELAVRSGRTLATFDRKLAEAARMAGVKVFGDPSMMDIPSRAASSLPPFYPESTG
jgi:predicted nucleic acid-binding protein